MAESIQVSKKQILYLTVCVMLAAFLGVAVGGYVVRLKVEKAARPESSVLLKKGQSIPDHVLIGLDGTKHQFLKLAEDKKTIVLFITTECPHYERLLRKLDSIPSELLSEYQIIGVSFEPVDKLKSYQAAMNFIIPLYNDFQGKFTGAHKIEAFPTLIGVNKRGKIVFVEVGNRPDKSIQDHLDRL